MHRKILPALIFLLALPVPARAVEYRLQVAHLYDRSFAHFLDGAIGLGLGELTMDRLERSLDGATVPSGALLYDRKFRGLDDSSVQAFQAAKAVGQLRPTDGRLRLWDEMAWDGKPGERSVWVIGSSSIHQQEVAHVALKGTGALRYYVPTGVSFVRQPLPTVSLPLQFLQLHEGRGTLWTRHLGKSVSFQDGIAAVIGVNQSPVFADWVYVLVQHPGESTTFKMVVGWDRRRGIDESSREGGSDRE